MPSQPSHRFRILAVDDNEDTLELIRVSLSSEFDVMTLSDPMDVYELMDLFEPDLLILDVMMPKITGFQLVEMLRRNPQTKDLPVLILSAKTAAGEIKHGYRLGATLYLTKPFQPDRLVKNVKTQFELNPPAPTRKSHTIGQLQSLLEKMRSYQEGHVRIAAPSLQTDKIVDYRQMIENKIKKQMDERRDAKKKAVPAPSSSKEASPAVEEPSVPPPPQSPPESPKPKEEKPRWDA